MSNNQVIGTDFFRNFSNEFLGGDIDLSDLLSQVNELKRDQIEKESIYQKVNKAIDGKCNLSSIEIRNQFDEIYAGLELTLHHADEQGLDRVSQFLRMSFIPLIAKKLIAASRSKVIKPEHSRLVYRMH